MSYESYNPYTRQYEYPKRTNLEMDRTDYSFYYADPEAGEIHLLGGILSYSMEWPAYLNYKNEWFKFETNELMPEQAIGNNHGHAKYVKVLDDEVPEKYLKSKYYI